MLLDPTICHRALRSRDRRFDGRFFVGVTTTGIYCRPVCPARTPRVENVRFYACAAAAEDAGFRPCKRCRPECAPGTPAWVGTSATVARALRLIAHGDLDESRLDVFAARLGVSERHLGRLFHEHMGAAPGAVARAARVHLARTLLDGTDLPMLEVAATSGFRSVRQFNHAIRRTFGCAPSALRSRRMRSPSRATPTLTLGYRPPYDVAALLAYLGGRATPGVERVEARTYARTIRLPDGTLGAFAATFAPDTAIVQVRVELEAWSHAHDVVARVRRVLDLDADPRVIDEHLARSPRLARQVRAHRGLRVPGAWDPFELTVRAILGQQVTVAGATTLAGRLAARWGESAPAGVTFGLTHAFPSPQVLAEADLSGIGLTRARAETIRAFARAFADAPFTITDDPADVAARLGVIRGIGEWTIAYVAMRALGAPDAFPASDLGVRKALAHGGTIASPRAADAAAAAWQPWRAYAVMHLWKEDS